MNRAKSGGGRFVIAALALAFGGAALAADATQGRIMSAPPGALACSGCHGMRPRDGALLPKITGRPAGEITAALASFRSGERAATVMGRIAKGFSPEEDRAIAAWLAEQR